MPDKILTDVESVIITIIDSDGIRIERVEKKNPSDCSRTIISREAMKAFCGDFPTDADGFSFNEIDHWERNEGFENFVAYVGGEPIGPDLKIIVIPDPIIHGLFSRKLNVA